MCDGSHWLVDAVEGVVAGTARVDKQARKHAAEGGGGSQQRQKQEPAW